MLRRLIAGVATAFVVLPAVTALAVVPASAGPIPAPAAPPQVQEQVLTWTANDSSEKYLSAPTTAAAGVTKIVFDNGPPHGKITHTLTFDQETPGYNHDVAVDLLANPFDTQDGRWETTVTLTPGKYRYHCTITGHSMMVGELIVTGGPDNTPPETSATVTGTKDTNGNYIGSATVTVTATDGQSGVDFIEYQVRDGSFQRYTAPVVISQAGDYSVQYRATDKQGNLSPVKSVSFSVVESPPDTNPPTVTANVTGTKDSNGNYVGSATVEINATDTVSGVKSREYKLDSGAWTTYTAPVVVNTLGAHTVLYRATDNAGNVSPEGSVSFTVVQGPDTTPPTVSSSVAGDKDPNGNYINRATVTITATDAGSGVKTIEYKLDEGAWTPYTAPVEVTSAGMHMLSYRATDNAGNTSPEGMTHFTVVAGDTTAPTVSSSVAGDKDPNGNYINRATVTITATDAGSGVKTIEYQLDGGAWTTYTSPVQVTTAGPHTVRYRATDNANNVSPEGSTSFTVVAGDTTPPTVTGAASGDRDTNGNYLDSARVTITATDAGSGVKSTEYKVDSGAWTAYTAPFDVTALGAHTVLYRATDNANNVSPEGTLTFTVVRKPVDNTPPTVNATVAGDKDSNGNYIASATVTVTASDTQTGVKSAEYKLDGGAWTLYTAPVQVNTVGAHTVTYRATDNANNVSPEGTVSFTVVARPPDTTPPTTSVTIAGPKDPNGNYIDTASVTVTATDSQSGVGLVEYKLDDGAWTQYISVVRVSARGPHKISYRATDNAGNTAAEKSESFTVVEPDSDACPNSDTRATVIIERDDTKVANVDTGNGCTVSDVVDQYGEYPGHAAFVRHVEQVTDDLVAKGVLTPRDASTIVRAAARSDIGR